MKSYDLVAIRQYFPSIENPIGSIWVYDQLNEVQKAGIRPLVISQTPIVPEIIRIFSDNKPSWKIKSSSRIKSYKGIDVIRPEYLKLPSSWFLGYNLRKASSVISSSSKGIKFKLIHAHFGHDGICAIPLKIERKVPLITSFYGFDLGIDKERLKKYYKKLSSVGDLFLALSQNMANDLLSLGFPQEKVIVHHLGVNLNQFTPGKISKDESFVFLIVANFYERKGIHHSIRAFKIFKQKHPDEKIQLRIVGTGPFKNVLLHESKNMPNIVFINNYSSPTPREIVQMEIRNCDVFVLTSITVRNSDKEGTPIVLMEAQASGKPCISTFHAGIPEVVIDEKTGVLVNEGDIQSIADSMELFYTNHEKRILYGKNARAFTEKEFNNEIQSQKLVNIYRSYS